MQRLLQSPIYLVELPIERLPEDLPAIKAAWLKTGDTEALKAALQVMSSRAWTIAVEKFKPVALTPAW